jgi:hypothetical protein
MTPSSFPHSLGLHSILSLNYFSVKPVSEGTFATRRASGAIERFSKGMDLSEKEQVSASAGQPFFLKC